MQNATRLLACASAFFGFVTVANAQDAITPDTVVATVNGTAITAGELVVVRRQLPPQYASLPPEALLGPLVDQMVRQQLLAETIESEPESLKHLLNVTRRSNVAARAIDSIYESAVTDEAVQEAYDAQYTGTDLGLEYNASHILVETEEEAQALIAELAGGADFAELAREHSTGPSGPNGGSLGWFRKGMMVPPFENAVVALQPGSVTETPVQTQFGWHVILMVDTRGIDAPPLAEVRSTLEAEIQNTSREEAIEALRAAAVIEQADLQSLDPAFLNDEGFLSN